jgi:hypothetical protein
MFAVIERGTRMLKPLARFRRVGRHVATAAVLGCVLAPLLYGGVRTASAAVSVGSSGGDFLSFEVGGRSAGMGGAQVSTATGVTAQFWNPAGLAGLQDVQVGAMHASWLDGLSYEWVGYAKPLGPRLGVGSLSVAYFHMPSIQGVDEFDNPTESFSVYDVALTAGLARPLTRQISVGMNTRLIRQKLATVSATGVGVDLGAVGTFQGTSVAAVVQNLGPSLSYDGASYPLPRQVRFGMSRRFVQEKLLLAADYNMPRDYFNDGRLGVEYRAHPIVSLRMGYRQVFGSSNDPGTGLSYGLGLHVKQMALDYAMTPNQDFDNVHRFAIGYSFGSGAEDSDVKPTPPKKEKPLPPPPPSGPTSVASSKKPKPKQAEPVRVLAQAPVSSAAPAPVETSRSSETVAVAPQSSAPKPSASIASIEEPAPIPAPPVKAPESGPKAKEEDVEPAPKPAKEAKPAKVITEFAVVLPGYQSKDGAQAELKALQLLGFRVKDATIVANDGGGYSIRLAKMKSKDSAEDMVDSLSRMSFRALVQTVQR